MMLFCFFWSHCSFDYHK